MGFEKQEQVMMFAHVVLYSMKYQPARLFPW